MRNCWARSLSRWTRSRSAREHLAASAHMERSNAPGRAPAPRRHEPLPAHESDRALGNHGGIDPRRPRAPRAHQRGRDHRGGNRADAGAAGGARPPASQRGPGAWDRSGTRERARRAHRPQPRCARAPCGGLPARHPGRRGARPHHGSCREGAGPALRAGRCRRRPAEPDRFGRRPGRPVHPGELGRAPRPTASPLASARRTSSRTMPMPRRWPSCRSAQPAACGT